MEFDAALRVICTHCGGRAYSVYTPRGAAFLAHTWCAACVRELCKNTVDKKFSKPERFKRVIARASRHRILSRDEVLKIANDVARRLTPYGPGATVRSLEKHYSNLFLFGAYKGEPLLDRWKDSEHQCGSLKVAWSEMEKLKKPLTENEMHLAILLTFLGDKDAIRHSRSKQLWGRKTTNFADYNGRA